MVFCMPCTPVLSDGVALGPVTALQTASSVWGRLAPSGAAWVVVNWFVTCPGKFLVGIYELHYCNDASDVDRLLTALAELADG